MNDIHVTGGALGQQNLQGLKDIIILRAWLSCATHELQGHPCLEGAQIIVSCPHLFFEVQSYDVSC